MVPKSVGHVRILNQHTRKSSCRERTFTPMNESPRTVNRHLHLMQEVVVNKAIEEHLKKGSLSH